MKLSTQVWTRMESKGKPQQTQTFHGDVRESIMHIAGWLNGVYMGSKIVITMARTEAELEESKRSSDVKDMIAELDGMLADRPDNQLEDSNGHQA